MRVLFVPISFPLQRDEIGGNYIKRLAMDLSMAGINIEVLVLRNKKKLWQKKEYRYIEVSDYLKIHEYFFYTPSKINTYFQTYWLNQILSIVNEININSFDLIHSHGYVASIIGNAISMKYEKQHVISLHHSNFIEGRIKKWREPILKNIFNSCYSLIVPSSCLKESIVNEYSSENIKVIPNYIDFNKITIKESLPKTASKLIAISSDEKIKNNSFYPKFSEKNRIHIDVYGTTNKKYSGKYCEFKGEIEHNTILNLIPSYDGLISLSKIETFGIGILEGLASGLPVMALNTCGSKSYINENNGVFLNETLSIKEFSNNYTNYSTRKISKEIESFFSKEKIIPKYIKVYKELCVE